MKRRLALLITLTALALARENAIDGGSPAYAGAVEIVTSSDQVIWNTQAGTPLGSPPQPASFDIAGRATIASGLDVNGPSGAGLLSVAGGPSSGVVTVRNLIAAGSARITDTLNVGGMSVLPRTGTTPPSETAVLGQLYIDTAAGDAYICVGTAPTCWKKITAGQSCESSTSVSAGAGIDRNVMKATPNPSPRGFELRFALPDDAHAEVTIYDVSGRVVRALAQGSLPRGSTAMEWNGKDDADRDVAPGVYVARIAQGAFRQEIKLTVVR